MVMAMLTIYPCRKHAGDDSAIVDADTLFPCVVWTVVHANASNIHCRLGHILRCVTDQERNFGEVGFCLSLVEGELRHPHPHPFPRPRPLIHSHLRPHLHPHPHPLPTPILAAFLSAALAYILQLSPSKFGLDDVLDADIVHIFATSSGSRGNVISIALSQRSSAYSLMCIDGLEKPLSMRSSSDPFDDTVSPPPETAAEAKEPEEKDADGDGDGDGDGVGDGDGDGAAPTLADDETITTNVAEDGNANEALP